MANDVTELQHENIARIGFAEYLSILLPFTVFANDFSNEIAEQGDTVGVPLFPAAVVKDMLNPANNWENLPSDVAVTKAPITLDRHKASGFAFTGKEMQSLRNDRFDLMVKNRIQQGAGALAEEVSTDILGLVLAANFPAVAYTGLAASYDSDVVADLWGVAKAAKWRGLPGMVVDLTYIVQLMKDPDIKGAWSFANRDPEVRSMIHETFNFDLHGSGVIPDNGENLTGFICKPDAIGILQRLADIPTDKERDYTFVKHMTDPETGISMTYTSYWSKTDRKQIYAFDVQWGRGVVKASSLKRIVSA